MSEAFTHPCPSCGSVLRAPVSAAGKLVLCRQCNARFKLPEQTSLAAAEESAPKHDTPEAITEPVGGDTIAGETLAGRAAILQSREDTLVGETLSGRAALMDSSETIEGDTLVGRPAVGLSTDEVPLLLERPGNVVPQLTGKPAKPPEPKPADARPAAPPAKAPEAAAAPPRPAEPKPTASPKPTETKAIETKAAEPRPAEAKPPEPRPAPSGKPPTGRPPESPRPPTAARPPAGRPPEPPAKPQSRPASAVNADNVATVFAGNAITDDDLRADDVPTRAVAPVAEARPTSGARPPAEPPPPAPDNVATVFAAAPPSDDEMPTRRAGPAPAVPTVEPEEDDELPTRTAARPAPPPKRPAPPPAARPSAPAGDSADAVTLLQSLGITKVALLDEPDDDPTVRDKDAAAAARRVVAGNAEPVELSRGGPDKYKVVRELARGGMGAILLARDRDVNRDVAMKVMLDPDAAGREGLARFLEEAQATGQLEHPNIVPVHDIGLNADGNLYFTMKYVRGRSLKEILDGLRRGNDPRLAEEFTLTRLLQIFQQVCNAVGFANSRGVVHRDLKPANIMVGAFGEVLVMDWGLARILTRGERRGSVATTRSLENIDATQEGAVAGTPQYMPPEQAAGDLAAIDARSDVYALGAILYTILSHKPPFQGRDATTILTKVLADPPDKLTPAKIYRRVPRELPAIALKAMSKDKAGRYPTALDLAADVQRFLEGRSVSALPDGLLRRTWKFLNRHRAASLGTVAAVVLAAAAAGGTFAWQRYEAERLRHEAIAAELLKGKQALQGAGYTRPKPAGEDDDYGAALATRQVQFQLAASNKDLLEAVRRFQKVLELEPGHADARRGLTSAYLELWRLAFLEGNRKLMDAYGAEAAFWGGEEFETKHAPLIRGDGRLRLRIANAEAEAFLFRFVTADGQYGRLVPIPWKPGDRPDPADARDPAKDFYPDLPMTGPDRKGPPPAGAGDFPDSRMILRTGTEHRIGFGREIAVDRLALGSYLILLRSQAFEPLRVPVNIGRNADGLGETVDLTVEMVARASVPEGFTYVPRVQVLIGGPTGGRKWSSPRRRTVGPFFLQTREVTLREYFAFLTDLRKTDPAAADKHRPKSFDPTTNAAADGKDSRHLIEFVGDEIRPLGEWDKPGMSREDWVRKWDVTPIAGVSWLDAAAFVQWKNRTAGDGRKYRLPTDDEWEAAARGADGRIFSWGDHFRPEAAKLNQGYGSLTDKELDELRAKGLDFDESPSGVWDLAGSVAEWTDSVFQEGRPDFRSIRGNAWGLTPTGLQCAFRTTGSSLNYHHITIGFRLACDAGKTGP
jgi:serine/threonine-protein kinase